MAAYSAALRELVSLSGAVNPRFALCDLLVSLLPRYALGGVRAELYRLAGCQLAPAVTVQGPLVMLGAGPATQRLRVGSGCVIGPSATFVLDGEITIGQNVSIGPSAAFHTATHNIGFGSRRMQLLTHAYAITVEDGVWIGAHSLVMPGVTVGRGSVVSAGSVVTESVPANVLVAGNPATVRESLPFGNR
jgi:acetyltransferase-like isoleucine patch superfamily enzyme